MKKSALTAIFLLIFLSDSVSQSVTGTWVFTGGNIELTLLLNPDGTGEFQGLPVKYKVQNNQLYLDDGISPVVYNYKLTQNSLVLSGGGMQMAVTFNRPGSSNQAGNQQGINPNQNQYQSQGMNQTGSGSGYNQNQQSVTGMSGMAGTGSGQSAVNAGGSGLTGIWEGTQGKLIFYPDGTMLYNNTSYTYSLSGNQMIIGGTDGSISFGYNQSGNSLTLSQNASSAQYTKTSSLRNEIVDPQLAGKWCIVSSNYNNYSGGGSSSEECITLNADGTYTYFFSSSRSAYTYDQSAYGGSANQNGDNGTWKTDGLTIVSVSRTTGKTSRYSLAKENNENGDAMIVIGGKKFVTAYQRPRW